MKGGNSQKKGELLLLVRICTLHDILIWTVFPCVYLFRHSNLYLL